MKLLFATSISYPSKHANRQQTIAMAKEYGRILGSDFILSGCGISLPEEHAVQVENITGIQKSPILAMKHLRHAKRERVTHILCREGRLFLFLSLFQPFLYRGAVLVFEEHSFPARISMLYRFMLRRAERIIATTSIIKNALAEIVPEKRIHVAPHGVDASVFDIPVSKEEARAKLELPIDETIWGYTGTFKTFNTDKGISDILKALVKAVEKDPNILFVAVGGNEKDRAFYTAQAQELSIETHVRLIGYVDKDTLALYQKACDMLFMTFPYTEYYARYMLPLKTFEYMASGRPIIASDLPSIREVLNEENAKLVPPDSPNAIAGAALHIAADDVYAQKIADQAHADIKAYTWEKRATSIIAFLQHGA